MTSRKYAEGDVVEFAYFDLLEDTRLIFEGDIVEVEDESYTGSLVYLIKYTDEEGEVVDDWFTEESIIKAVGRVVDEEESDECCTDEDECDCEEEDYDDPLFVLQTPFGSFGVYRL